MASRKDVGMALDEVIRIQVVLKPTSNIAKDYVTNTFHFRITSDEPSPIDPDGTVNGQIGKCMDALEGFYNDMSYVIFGGLATNGHQMKAYRLSEATPRFPRVERTFNFAFTPNPLTLPAECAIVASFESFEAPGFSQRSRRNRVYLGTLAASVSDGAGRIADTARVSVNTAMQNLHADEDEVGVTGWIWVTYSPKLNTYAPVTAGHVDNAFDTQRRRGVSSTFRSTWGSTATAE
uniref:Uncharacterized protein n=1 Tax=uncultured prokaryote TaxID=198431 RepID=A0A0H5Q6M2_9ZZZZ|nr:hypothetical protein [uncultured prokaryote]